MKIESLTLENFGSFAGRHEVPLAGRGIVFVLGQNEDDPRSASNGAGKSTLFDALEWALFGDAPKGDAADSVVNEAEGKGTVVTVRLLDGEERISVQRYRKLRGRSGLRLWVGAHVADSEDAEVGKRKLVERTALDTRETQRQLEALLGLDRDVFRAAVYRSQTETFSFAEATDAERKDLLTRILRLGEIDQWLETAKHQSSENGAEQARSARREAELVGELRTLESVDHVAQVAEWERQRESRLEFLRGRYVAVRAHVDELVRAIAREDDVRSALASAQTRIPHVPPETDLSAIIAERRSAADMVRTLELRSAELTQEIAAARSRTSGTCPTCGQAIDASHAARAVAALSDELRSVHAQHIAKRAELESITMELESHRSIAEAKRASHAAALIAHGGDARRLEIELEAIGRKRTELGAAERDLAGLEATGRGIKLETNPYVAAADRARERLSAVRQELTSLGEQRAALEARKRLLDFWVQGFSARGLKSYILDARLSELNEAANQWVKLLTGGTVWVRFETQTLAKSTKTLTEKFNIRVFRWNPDGKITERNFRSWSGGEKARIALGIDFGLSRLVASRASKPYDLLILDEVFRHLDGKGREAVLDLLQHLAAEKSSIFVIDHDRLFQGEFESTLCVRKRDGRSEVLA